MYKISIFSFSFLILSFSLLGCENKKIQSAVQNSTSNDSTIIKSEADWKKQLTENQYYILREKGTERPGTSEFNLHKEKGIYKCGGCGQELFTDEMKFESHCGWPSFDREIAGGKIKQIEDNTHGMSRTEIVCARCNGHLGHIFNDGPTATGQRYCVNGGALSFESFSKSKAIVSKIDTITLGGGCFWCTEAVFEELKGVIKVESGYSGGKNANTNYEDVSSGMSGHAEVIQITYNTKDISLLDILKVFFTVHDPTTLNRQGADAGTQYRSGIYYRNESQKKIASDLIQALNTEKVYDNAIVTEVKPFNMFVKAEEYHQDYYQNNKNKGYCQAVIQPKLEKFNKVFSHLKK